ncbi:MAG: LPS assembly protein LptD [Proteobacteria bacterium]|nr:LPS assembly protein LptD [Pseudomonadota bacterium]
MKRVTLLFLLLIFLSPNSFALPKGGGKSDPNAQTILKADEIDGDRITNILTATGNVEITREASVVYADQVTYNKNGKTIRAIGHVRIKNFEIGNMLTKEAEMQDDFSKGTFTDSRIFFNDGSYLFASRMERENQDTTVLHNSIFSICPNEKISKDNTLAGDVFDFLSIKSSKTTVDRKEGKMRSKHSFFRLYNVPIFYTPYSSVALPSKERESGFLNPSYNRTTNFGLGFKIPYYVNIAPNMDLTITPQIYSANNQVVVTNNFRHLTSYGDYRMNLEVANNKVTNTNDLTVVKRTSDKYRGSLIGDGRFDFTKNAGADFNIKTISDRDYMRDYHLSYLAYTLSTAKFDYIKGRDYYSIKAIRVQELEDTTNQNAAPLLFPTIDAHIESKPIFSKETFALTSNVTTIYRKDGLEYRRATAVPEAKLPFNIKGNLFDLNAKVQNDFYWLEDNFKNTPQTNYYQSVQNNYKPEISANWRLPLIKKAEKNTVMIEPMASFVASSFKKDSAKLPNEDSNNSELTVSNLFTSDRIYGFDRNEAGQRTSYGVKSSLFNSLGEFGLTFGQSYRIKDQVQDVAIRGFSDNNFSNYIGQAMYRAKKNFSLNYSFQLNESNFKNDVNQLGANFYTNRLIFSSDYLLLRKSAQNSTQREQITFSSSVKMSDLWKGKIMATKDLVTNRMISRGITLYRDGCCTIFSFSVIENSPINLTKPQRSFSFLITFKNI